MAGLTGAMTHGGGKKKANYCIKFIHAPYNIFALFSFKKKKEKKRAQTSVTSTPMT